MGLRGIVRRWLSSSTTEEVSRCQGVKVSRVPDSVLPSTPRHLDTSTPLLPPDLPMMRRALDLARQAAALGEVPIGAVVYETQSGRILGEGFNRREIDKDPAAHAELF